MIQLRVALEECGTDDAARARCQLGIGMVLILAGDWRTARRHLAESVHLSEQLDDEELQVTALSKTGHLDERMAPGSGRAALETAARVAAGRLIPWAGMCPDALLAAVHYWADEIEPARALLLGVRERAVPRATSRASPTRHVAHGARGAGRQPATRPSLRGRVDRNPRSRSTRPEPRDCAVRTGARRGLRRRVRTSPGASSPGA